MAVQASVNIKTDWEDFVKCLDAGLARARNRWWKPHRRDLEAWHEEVIKELASDDTVKAMVDLLTAGTLPDAEPQHRLDDRSKSLLIMELQAVTQMLADMTGTKIRTPVPSLSPHLLPSKSRKPPGTVQKLKRILFRRINVTDALKAAGTLTGSLKDLLDAFPALKSLFTISKEAIDTVTQ